MDNIINKIFNIRLVYLLGILIIASCNEQEDIMPMDEQLSGVESEANLQSQVSTTVGADTINGSNQVPSGPPVGDYCLWGREIFTLDNGGPTLAFEGQFNSFIRPLTFGWFIGTIPLNQFNNSFQQLTITPKFGDLASDPFVLCRTADGDPDTYSASPSNVLGAIGTPPIGDPNADFGLGYYDYDEENQPVIQTAIVIWRGSINPANATEAFAIRVNELTAVEGFNSFPPMGPPDFFTSQIIFDQRSVL